MYVCFLLKNIIARTYRWNISTVWYHTFFCSAKFFWYIINLSVPNIHYLWIFLFCSYSKLFHKSDFFQFSTFFLQRYIYYIIKCQFYKVNIGNNVQNCNSSSHNFALRYKVPEKALQLECINPPWRSWQARISCFCLISWNSNMDSHLVFFCSWNVFIMACYWPVFRISASQKTLQNQKQGSFGRNRKNRNNLPWKHKSSGLFFI